MTIGFCLFIPCRLGRLQKNYCTDLYQTFLHRNDLPPPLDPVFLKGPWWWYALSESSRIKCYRLFWHQKESLSCHFKFEKKILTCRIV